MSLPDAQEWVEAYDKEFMGIKQRGVFETVRMEKGMKIMGMTTRTEYKVTNGVFGKHKVRLCARWDQHEEGLQFNERDIYSLVLKSAEVSLMVAIAAQHGAKMYKTDTTQAFLYGYVEEDLFVRAQTGGRNLFQRDTASTLKKNIYGTLQAARAWHLRISGWMKSHGYPAINSEKTMFMKWDGDDFILHGLFMDDMSTILTSDHFKEEIMALDSADFDVTGGDLMQSFLGLEVEQLDGCIKLHLVYPRVSADQAEIPQAKEGTYVTRACAGHE